MPKGKWKDCIDQIRQIMIDFSAMKSIIYLEGSEQFVCWSHINRKSRKVHYWFLIWVFFCNNSYQGVAKKFWEDDVLKEFGKT